MRQIDAFNQAHRQIADGNAHFLEMVDHPTNPLTNEDLRKLIERRPERWSRFAGFLGKLRD